MERKRRTTADPINRKVWSWWVVGNCPFCSCWFHTYCEFLQPIWRPVFFSDLRLLSWYQLLPRAHSWQVAVCLPNCKCSFVLLPVWGMESRTLFWLGKHASKLQPHALHYKWVDIRSRKLGSQTKWYRPLILAHTNIKHKGESIEEHYPRFTPGLYVHAPAVIVSPNIVTTVLRWSCFRGCLGVLCRGASGMFTQIFCDWYFQYFPFF